MSESITIIGRLAADPRSVQTSNGSPMASFRVGCDYGHFDRTRNEWVTAGTNWYGVTAFRSLAANVLASLRRGERVIVTGKLRLREWEHDGKKGFSADIDAHAVGHDLLWGRSSFESTGGGRNAPQSSDAAADAPASDRAAAASDAPGADEWAAPGQTWEQEATVPF